MGWSSTAQESTKHIGPGPGRTPRGSGAAENGYGPAEEKMAGGRQDTICGLRRKVFFIVILSGVLVAVAAIAIGIGAGVAFSKSRSPNTEKILDASSDISCPDDNDEVLEAHDGYYRIRCDIDFPVSVGASDMATEDADSLGRCAELCSDRDDCVGASWRDGRCVLKGALGRSVGKDGLVIVMEIDKPSGAD